MEKWIDIEGFDGKYQVSNFGRVRSTDSVVKYRNGGERIFRGAPIKEYQDHRGYRRVGLTCSGKTRQFRVHRLVAIAFIENRDLKPQVNHIDGDKSNNCVSNLEWCDNYENRKHQINHYKKNDLIWGKPILQIDVSTNAVVGRFRSLKEASENTGFYNKGISLSARGITESYRGFKWVYESNNMKTA